MPAKEVCVIEEFQLHSILLTADGLDWEGAILRFRMRPPQPEDVYRRPDVVLPDAVLIDAFRCLLDFHDMKQEESKEAPG